MPETIQAGLLISKIRYKNADAPTDEERGIKARFLEKWPQLHEKVITYQANPACTCAGEMQAEIIKDAAMDEKASYVMGYPVKVVTPKSIMGEVHTIEDSDTAFKSFVLEAAKNGWHYRGMYIMKEEPFLKLYLY